MPRKDYDEIKDKFARFVKTWKDNDENALDALAYEDIECHISSCKNSNDEYDKLTGLKTFVRTYPKTDVWQGSIYSYACHLKDDQAQQVAYVICESTNYVEGQEVMDGFQYCILCASHWIKKDDNWKMSVIHMDVYPFYWTSEEYYDYFKQTWYFGPKLISPDDTRLPAIESEFDLPWEVIPDTEDVLTEEEKIIYTYAKTFFSSDYSDFRYRCSLNSRHMDTNSKRWGEYDTVRSLFGAIRYKKQKDRYWAHPLTVNGITFNEDKTWAIGTMYRVFGYKQREHEYVWTRSNVGKEHIDMAGEQQFVKEDGVWKVTYGDAPLLLYTIGNFEESMYGDDIIYGGKKND